MILIVSNTQCPRLEIIKWFVFQAKNACFCKIMLNYSSERELNWYQSKCPRSIGNSAKPFLGSQSLSFSLIHAWFTLRRQALTISSGRHSLCSCCACIQRKLIWITRFAAVVLFLSARTTPSQRLYFLLSATFCAMGRKWSLLCLDRDSQTQLMHTRPVRCGYRDSIQGCNQPAAWLEEHDFPPSAGWRWLNHRNYQPQSSFNNNSAPPRRVPFGMHGAF